MEPHGITAAQFKVMIIIAQFGVDTPAELCRHLSLDSGSMTRMLDRLEQKGLLARKRSEQDRRQVQLVLTEDGQRLLDARAQGNLGLVFLGHPCAFLQCNPVLSDD